MPTSPLFCQGFFILNRCVFNQFGYEYAPKSIDATADYAALAWHTLLLWGVIADTGGDGGSQWPFGIGASGQ